jgi:hypothetical protein
MISRLLALALCAVLTFGAEMSMTVEQLKEFIRSSIKMKYPDKEVADYLHKVKLTSRLDDRTIEELQGEGAGFKTVAALHDLRDASASLPAPPPPPPKVIYVPPPPPSSIEQARVLEAITEYARNYTKRMPNFLCAQITKRYVDVTGNEGWRSYDTIDERLSFVDGHEDYKVISRNNTYLDVKHNQLGGTISSGEWASMMGEIFDPATNTRFEWERWGKLRGRIMHVFTYRVLQEYSKYHIYAQGVDPILVGYHGLIYADRDTLVITKITMQADNIPAGFPVREASESLDYASQKIGEQAFILPLAVEMDLRNSSNMLFKNDIEFRMYQKFSTEATITFGSPDAPPPDTKEQPLGPGKDESQPPAKKK